MKNFYVLLFVTLLLSCNNKKEEIITPPVEVKKEVVIEPTEPVEVKNEIIFTVQIAAMKTNNTSFSSIENIKIFNENGLIKYRLGDFKTYDEAKKYKKYVRNNYPDAFVQALKNGYPIHITEALYR